MSSSTDVSAPSPVLGEHEVNVLKLDLKALESKYRKLLKVTIRMLELGQRELNPFLQSGAPMELLRCLWYDTEQNTLRCIYPGKVEDGEPVPHGDTCILSYVSLHGQFPDYVNPCYNPPNPTTNLMEAVEEYLLCSVSDGVTDRSKGHVWAGYVGSHAAFSCPGDLSLGRYSMSSDASTVELVDPSPYAESVPVMEDGAPKIVKYPRTKGCIRLQPGSFDEVYINTNWLTSMGLSLRKLEYKSWDEFWRQPQWKRHYKPRHSSKDVDYTFYYPYNKSSDWAVCRMNMPYNVHPAVEDPEPEPETMPTVEEAMEIAERDTPSFLWPYVKDDLEKKFIARKNAEAVTEFRGEPATSVSFV